MSKSQKGQSSIEFIMSFTVAIGIFFIFVSLAFNYTAGYIAHNATFHASRIFLTYDNAKQADASHAGAVARARNYFNNRPLKRFQVTDAGTTPQVEFNIPGSNSFYVYYGAYFSFTKPLSIYRLMTGDTQAVFTSESYLGREPTREECRTQICQAMGVDCSQGYPDEFQVTLFDNGC